MYYIRTETERRSEREREERKRERGELSPMLKKIQRDGIKLQL